jgi:hypothetical protein
MKPANPENVPLDKIPAGWRLLYEEEYQTPRPVRVWNDDHQHEFSGDIDPTPSFRHYTYITPDLPDNGQPWHAHKPGDPAPVASGVKVDLIHRNGIFRISHICPNWSNKPPIETDILFYRLHEPATNPNPKATFEAHGHTWFKHTPGDPMPCDGESLVHILLEHEARDNHYQEEVDYAREYYWGGESGDNYSLVGWCYAEPKPKDPSAQAGRTSLPITAAEPTVKPHNPHISDRILELLIVAGHVTPEKVEQARKLAQP